MTAHPSRRGVLGAAALLGLAGTAALLAGCAPEPDDPAPAEPRPDPAPDPAPEPAPAPVLLLASLAHAAEVAVIDPALPDAEAVQRIAAGASPWGVGTSPDGRVGYAATAEGLAVLDLRARRRTALVPYLHPAAEIGAGEYRPGGLGLAVAADGASVAVAVAPGDGSWHLEEYDVEAGAFARSAPVGARPFDVLADPAGAWVASVDHDGFTVTVVDTADFTAVQHRVAPFGEEGGLASWEKPHYGAVDAGADAEDGAGAASILLPFQGQVVLRLDPRTGDAAAIPSAANSHAHGTALAGRRLLTVGTGAFGSATGAPNLSILDVDTGAERVVPLAVPHETVALWRDGDGAEYAAVAGGNTRDEGWDGITLIALDGDGERAIPIPGYPQAVVGFAER
ncbi:hypothetical protein MUN78_05460 [Leucobacter allii]|uniref:Uncharacterized protein n=1 Tax=Leucobacter allii TaxID=2932247 RepID=A0ABY4FPT0_9MICO|nr:hypothetical protein [Leucobacter allii]UOQ58291.1 hypothetical protein MUN78_05460 [Leucobacter allii]